MKTDLADAINWICDYGTLDRAIGQAIVTHARVMASAPLSRAEIAMRLMAGMVSNPFYGGMQNKEIAECAVDGADTLLAALAAPGESK